MKTLLRYLPLGFSVLLIACEKEEYDVFAASERYCHDNMVFTCEDVPDADIYFRAKLRGEDFCLTVPGNNYHVTNGVATISTSSTADPTLSPDAPTTGSFFTLSIRPPIFDNLNGLTRDFQPSFVLHTPRINDTIVHPPEWYIEKYLREGELPIRRHGEPDSLGFFFMINWTTVLRPGYEYYQRKDPDRIPVVGLGLSPTFGAASQARLKLVEMRKRDFPEGTRYYFTFKISGDLYYSGSQYAGDYFGKMEDGEFRMILEL